MTEVASTTNTANTTSNGNATATPQNFGQEFTSFIQLLTAQVRNQDPLSPMDSTQFVEQLATFSTLGDLHAIIASDWLGQKISVESSWVPYGGSEVEFTADIPDAADRAVLSVRNTDGDVVHTRSLKSKDDTYTWDGKLDGTGEEAADGIYQFSIDLFDEEGGYLGTMAPRIITTVTDVSTEDGETVLGTESHLTTDVSNARKEE